MLEFDANYFTARATCKLSKTNSDNSYNPELADNLRYALSREQEPVTADMRRYKREWIARRRAAWMADKVCEHCGSKDRLEIDHIDPEEKISHKVWSWRPERRDAELAKCRVLCHDCHVQRHAAQCGTTRRYSLGCRCEACCRANANRGQAWKLRRVMERRLGLPNGALTPYKLTALTALRASWREQERTA